MGEGRRDCHYSACCLSWEWVWASAGRVWGLDYCPLCSPGSWSASHGVQSVGSSLGWWEMAQGFLFCVCQELLHFLGVFVRDHTGVTALEVEAELGWWQAVCVGGRKTTRMATGGEKKKPFSHITYRIIAWILTWLAFKFKLKIKSGFIFFCCYFCCLCDFVGGTLRLTLVFSVVFCPLLWQFLKVMTCLCRLEWLLW